MKKILVPVDFSKPAINAVAVAADIARKSGAQIILLHVIQDIVGDSINVEGEFHNASTWEEKIFIVKLIDKTKKQLNKMLEEAPLKDVDAKYEIRMGTPYHGMTTIIKEHNVDLVVMGTSGRSELQQMIIGSNTEKVVRMANCPVLTVHDKPSSTEFRNIVYATSMEQNEEVFSRIIRTTQSIYGSTIHLVRINTPGNFQRDAVVRVYMEAFAKKLQLKNYTINVFNDLTEEEGILNFAEILNADLIAMATHGRTGFAHVLAGSIAEDVVQHAKRPVLTFVTKNRK